MSENDARRARQRFEIGRALARGEHDRVRVLVAEHLAEFPDDDVVRALDPGRGAAGPGVSDPA